MAKSAVEKAMETLERQLSVEYEATAGILRQGDRIIIPQFMGYADAAEALMKFEKAMNEQAKTRADFDCHPDDGLYALYTSVKAAFGNLMGAQIDTFFGPIPGKSQAITIGFQQTINVPVGTSEIPGVPIMLDIMPHYDPDDDDGGSLTVFFMYRRKFEPLIKKIEEMTREQLRTHSIFKGKAIDSKFQFLNVEGFDESRVVYSRHEERAIRANILSPIIHSEKWLASGSSLKRGILMHGQYGTGKTLTALLTGKTCVHHGWTFINVLPGDDIVKSLRFAKRYEPCAVFFEDIDADTSGKRDDRINEILNSIDGLLAKDSRVMCILTTNHIENINRGMLRPGRLDSIIELGQLDKDAVCKLIHVLAGDHLKGDLDADEIWAAAEGYVPAFIVEAVTKAKAYALADDGAEDHRLSITHQNVVDALYELRPQWEMMNSEQVILPDSVDQALRSVVEKTVKEQTEPLAEKLEEIQDTLND